MLKLKEIKNSYAKLKSKYFQRTEEDKYCIQMLEEALENFNEEECISLEEWQEEMRLRYNVNI